MDELFVKVEFERDVLPTKLGEIGEKLTNQIKNMLSITAKVDLIPTGTLPVADLKSRRRLDPPFKAKYFRKGRRKLSFCFER